MLTKANFKVKFLSWQVLEKLKFMDLSHSKYLIETPNFRGVTNLKQLVLEDYVSLRNVHSSLGDLKNLRFFNLKNYRLLKSLPSSTCDWNLLKHLFLLVSPNSKNFLRTLGA